MPSTVPVIFHRSPIVIQPGTLHWEGHATGKNNLMFCWISSSCSMLLRVNVFGIRETVGFDTLLRYIGPNKPGQLTSSDITHLGYLT